MNKNIGRFAQKGGLTISQNREHMSRIGRIGGLKVSQNRDHMRQIAQRPRTRFVTQKTRNMIELKNQGVSVKTIAERFGLSQSAVYQAIRLGKRKLNDNLGSHSGTSEVPEGTQSSSSA